jgi:hypothetical protein
MWIKMWLVTRPIMRLTGRMRPTRQYHFGLIQDSASSIALIDSIMRFE